MFGRCLSSGSTTRCSLPSLAFLLATAAAMLALGPRPAEAQLTSTIPRQGIPTTQQGILTNSEDKPQHTTDDRTFTRPGIPRTQQGIPTNNAGEPPRSGDDLTAHDRRESAEGDKNPQIGRETRIPPPR